MNLLRAIEANARISKVLFQELEAVSCAFEDEEGVELNHEKIGRKIDKLIKTLDEFHSNSNGVAEPVVKIPDHDDKDILLSVQCCGK